jgi:acyl-CoA thioester hydrolase
MDDSTFPVVVEVPVRFKDIDVGGHAHHSHALVYFEEARAAYWERVTGYRGLGGVDYILAEISVRYRARVLWPDTLRVGVRTARLTRKTFEMEYEARTGDGTVVLTGRSTQIMFDYDASRTVPLPDGHVRAILELDPECGVSAASRPSSEPSRDG